MIPVQVSITLESLSWGEDMSVWASLGPKLESKRLVHNFRGPRFLGYPPGYHPNGNGCYFNFSEIASASVSVM